MDRSRHLPLLAASGQGQTENVPVIHRVARMQVLTAPLPSRERRVYRAAQIRPTRSLVSASEGRALAAQTDTFKSPGK
jgi:hypothetical protein